MHLDEVVNKSVARLWRVLRCDEIQLLLVIAGGLFNVWRKNFDKSNMVSDKPVNNRAITATIR